MSDRNRRSEWTTPSIANPAGVESSRSVTPLPQTLFSLNAPAWCWHVYDSHLEVNHYFVEQFGCRATTLTDLLDLLTRDSREQLLMLVGRSLRRKKPFSMQLMFERSEKPLSLWCSPLEGESGQSLVIGSMLDVDQDVDKFHENTELQQLLDSMRSAIWYMDRWGLVQHGNEQAGQWLSLDRAFGKNFMEVAPGWDDVAERHREIMQVIRSGCAVLDSLESRNDQGRRYWYRVDKIPTADAQGVVTGVLLVIKDVTDEVAKENALKESEARYRAFIANSSEAMYRFDVVPPIDVHLNSREQLEQLNVRACVAECNHVAAKLLGGHSPDSVLGLPLSQCGAVDFQAGADDFIQSGYRIQDYEVKLVKESGERLYYQISAMGIVEDGYLQRFWGTTRDVTEKKRYLERLEYQATHDSLTLLPNRNKLYSELEQLLLQRKPDQKMALMLLDLDRFKEINDTLGHQAGDKLLKQIGPRLEMELAEFPSLVARLGGDEFAILLSRIRNNQQAVVVGHRVLDAIRAPFEIEGLHTEISVSVGITICPDQADDVSTLMRYADVAMYHAKSERKGVSVYQIEYDPHTPKRLALMSDLGRAIREDQLELYFQPKINIDNREVYGFEALLRWHHPEMGFIPPNEFIPLVEMTELIHPMTLWVLENTIAQAKRWQLQGYQFSVAANLSAQNLLGDFLVERLDNLLKKYELPAQLLELEITESTIMVDPDRALKVLNGIAALGVTLAIDDFGTGYSSLAYLKKLPVRTLKIDGSFVTAMLEDEQDEIIVHSTINLAHNLGLKVVAEGVEDDEVLQRLKEHQCDQAQGYFIERPQPADKVDAWLADSSWTSALHSS
ncbi:MAG: putative bifunctional diguanylate cyclase/phosphodiesterase [Cellvibrionaceae bacterium]